MKHLSELRNRERYKRRDISNAVDFSRCLMTLEQTMLGFALSCHLLLRSRHPLLPRRPNIWTFSAPVNMCYKNHILLFPGITPLGGEESPSWLKGLVYTPTSSHSACLQRGYYCRMQLNFKRVDSLIYLSTWLSDKTLCGCAVTACSSGCGSQRGISYCIVL